MSNLTIQDKVTMLNDGFNNQNDQPYKDIVDDNVVFTRVPKTGLPDTKQGKQNYLAHLRQSWRDLQNPRSDNLSVTVQSVGNLSKAIVTYDSTYTPPNQNGKKTDAATSIMYFNADGKMIDITLLTR
jgi:hypothetical protein